MVLMLKWVIEDERDARTSLRRRLEVGEEVKLLLGKLNRREALLLEQSLAKGPYVGSR